MEAVVAAFNQEEALVGAFSVITNLQLGQLQSSGVDIQGVGAWSRYFSPRTDAFRQFQYIVNISNDIDIGPGAVESLPPIHSSQLNTVGIRLILESGFLRKLEGEKYHKITLLLLLLPDVGCWCWWEEC